MKKYTYKEFLKGECSILVNRDTIKRTLEKLSQTGLKWHSGANLNEFNPIPNQSLSDKWLCLVIENGSLGYSDELLSYAPLVTLNQLLFENDDIKSNDFIGLCVKSKFEELYSVGNLYYFKNGVTTRNDGDNSCKYSSIEDFNDKNESYYMVEIKEVKRRAKVGEYVKVVNALVVTNVNDAYNYKDGDVLKIVRVDTDMIPHCLSEIGTWLYDEEYVVLEGYREISSFTVGDMIKFVGTIKCFNRYEEWFKETGNLEYKSHYVIDKTPCLNRQYKIVAKGCHIQHSWYPNGVYAIQDLDTTQVFLVGDEGLKKID